MRLFVSGCSFTNRPIEEDNIVHRWPDQVAKRLNVSKLTNLGKSGAGNEYIFCSLYDYILAEKTPPDIVIAAWSRADRRDYQLYGKWNNDRVDLRGDREYFIDRTNRYKELLELFCKSRGIKYYSFQMIELFDEHRDNVQANTIGFLEKADENFVSELDRHPSALGHKIIGNYIYEDIQRSIQSA